MVMRIGGETPIIKYGLELSVEAPTGVTAAAPVLAGEVYKLGGADAQGGGYKAAACVTGDDAGNAILLMALHRHNGEQNLPLGVKVVSHNCIQVRRLPYNDADGAPTVGQSIEISANVKKIKGKAFAAGHGYVLFVDTDADDVEVLV